MHNPDSLHGKMRRGIVTKPFAKPVRPPKNPRGVPLERKLTRPTIMPLRDRMPVKPCYVPESVTLSKARAKQKRKGLVPVPNARQRNRA